MACGREPLFLPADMGAAGTTGVAGVTGAAGTVAAAGAAGVTGAAGTSPGATMSHPPIAGALGGPWLFFDSMRDLNRDIYAVQPDGSSLRRFTTSKAIEQEPAVSADGTMLAYSSDLTGTFQLYVMSLPAGVSLQVTARSGGAREPAWSPDGKRIAFHAGSGIYVIGVYDRNETFVADIPFDGGHPSFSAGGADVIFDGYNSIDTINLASGERTPIVPGFTGPVQHPSLSTVGGRIAFSVMCDPGINGVWLASLKPPIHACGDGTRLTFANGGSARFPAISPTGLVAYEHDFGTAHIAVVDPGQGGARDVTPGGDDRNPSWSPANLFLP